MSNENAQTDPSTRSQAYANMAPVWAKIETLLSGTSAMRAAGTSYMPQYENETETAYIARREMAVLYNVTKLTLDSWVGRPFSDPVKVDEDVPAQIEELLENVDLQGNDITTFSRRWFKEGVSKAFAHVLIDMPDTGNDKDRSAADDLREGVRPYWTFIKPENLIFAAGTMVDSREVLTHVRILEQEMEQVGFSERMVNKIRVFDLAMADTENGQELRVHWSLYREEDEDEWVLETPPTIMDINAIPLVTFYADRQGLMQGTSPLEDLADLNIAHWQSSSDQRNILVVSRFPILAGSGCSQEESEVEVGPKRMLYSTDPAGKFYYVEHSGASIDAGRQDLLDLEDKMSSYGADFLKKRPGGETATARALDSAESTSPLQDVANRFNDALSQAMAVTAQWLKIEDPGKIEVANEFGPEEINQADLTELGQARRTRDLSQEDYLEEMKRRGALRDDFDFEENRKRLDAEAAEFADTEVDIDPQAEE